MKHRAAVVLLTAAVALLTGCQSLVYVQESSLGVNVNAAQQGTPKLSLGYDREVFAVVPRFDPDGHHAEAMSLVSVSNVDTTGLDELVFNHYIATGEAAEKAVKDEAGLKMMRAAVFGDKAGR
jgi:hypothetical protein